MKGFLFCSVLCLVPAFLTGCSGGPDVPVAKVSGKVTVGGQPMSDILVTFMPTSGRPATGTTDASGSFSLSTFSSNDGAVLGPHKVKFAYAKPTPERGSDEPPPAEEPLPFNAKYTSEQTSGFSADVQKGKTNEFTFPLEK